MDPEPFKYTYMHTYIHTYNMHILTYIYIYIHTYKMNKAEMWDAAMFGHNGQKIDAFTKEEVKKKLMIERFQEEVG